MATGPSGHCSPYTFPLFLFPSCLSKCFLNCPLSPCPSLLHPPTTPISNASYPSRRTVSRVLANLSASCVIALTVDYLLTLCLRCVVRTKLSLYIPASIHTYIYINFLKNEISMTFFEKK
ncbi:expressed protein [Echinococcus multilocularis]|uniref:Expressed protein n=1 Tax=Echinococcus multilocularis TaxID=6211 RepID=A0A068YBY1_ECHMU|nr:expressed protein [Echinococcus multilocularis]